LISITTGLCFKFDFHLDATVEWKRVSYFKTELFAASVMNETSGLDVDLISSS